MKNIVLLMLLIPFVTATAQTVSVGVMDLTNEVFSIEDDRIVGAMGEQFQSMLDNITMDYSLTVLPLARMLGNLEGGSWEIIFPLSRTEDRDAWGEFITSGISVPFVIVTTDQSYDNKTDIEGKTIATLRGAKSMIDTALDYGAEVIELNSYEAAVSFALSGRAYGYLGPQDILTEFEESELADCKIMQFGSYEIGFYVSHESGRKAALNEALGK